MLKFSVSRNFFETKNSGTEKTLAAVKVSGSKKKIKIKNFQNVIILILLISSVLCDIKNDQGGRPLPLGWFTVSKVPKISELCCFDIESTKKKVKNQQINVCKWLKIVFFFLWEFGPG